MITTASVANATQKQLLGITYSIFLEDLDFALKSESEEKRKYYINHGKEVLLHLAENLDLTQDIAKQLMSIYIYIQNILINEWKKDDKLDEACQLIRKIQEGYEQIEEMMQHGTMNNIETVYAGMTYGKGYLNEVVIENTQRGFRA